MANLYGYREEERFVVTVEAAFDSPVNFIDTSNGYCEAGAAERRIGAVVQRRGGARRMWSSRRRWIQVLTAQFRRGERED
jgi:aryl-alcohol dehydrogenase-like predicted oxidoreductase